ncbi:MAG: nitrous oxide reductase family maturation protein NosD [Archaeoglobaceae archaeon]
MKGIRTVLTIVILCSLLASAQGDQTTVCDSDCNFTHIQPAISASKNGDTILIESGTYKENLFIDKRLKIVGEEVTLHPSSLYVPTVQITSDDVILEGLKVTDSSTAIKVMNTEDVFVFNCTFSRNDIGVSALGSQGINLVGNTFDLNRVHIMLQSTADTSIRQNKITGGFTGICVVDSEAVNATENNFREVNVGAALENSAENEFSNNNFKQCDAGVYSILSNDNQFSGNGVENTSLFLDLRLSAHNKISRNSVENCTYSRTANSDNNFYTLENMNLSGKGFEFSLINPSLPEEYVNLSQGINLTVSPPNSTDEGQINLKASVPTQKIVGFNLSSVGFYRLVDLELISNKTFQDDRVVINASVNQSGEYILLAQKEENVDNKGENSYSTSTTTEGIMMLAVVIASIVVMLYIIGKK